MYAIFIIIFFISVSFVFMCDNNYNCFSCNANPNCIWSNSSCIEATTINNETFVAKIRSCLNSNDVPSQNEICPSLTDNSIPLSLKIQFATDKNVHDIITSNNNEYAVQHLFCKWVIDDVKVDKSVKINLNKNILDKQKEELFIVVKTTKGDYKQYSRFPYKQTIHVVDIEQIEIFLFCENAFYTKIDNNDENYFAKSISFEVNVSYQLMSQTKMIWTIICSAIVLLLIVGTAVIIYYKVIKKRTKNNNNHNNMRYRISNNVHYNLGEGRQDAYENEKLESNRKLIKLMFIKQQFALIKNNINQMNCTICFETFEAHSEVIRLRCGHVFHYVCIKTWSESKIKEPTCPNCNMVIFNNMSSDVVGVEGDNDNNNHNKHEENKISGGVFTNTMLNCEDVLDK